MKRFWRAFDLALDGMAGCAGVILAFITLAICYEVMMRYFFKSPSVWIAQTTEYALLWIVFLGTTWLLREKGHVAVDILHARLPERGRTLLDVAMLSLGALACAVIFVFAVFYCHECVSRGVTDVRGVTVPKAAVFIIIPVGCFFLVIQFCRMVWEKIGRIRRGV
jgi:TRAP-type C4-dicarboxylate transport system permease small subunit